MRKRLRKKLGVGEFDVPLLPTAFEMKPFDSAEDRSSFLERFCREAIEANGLQFGGGGMDNVWSGFAEPGGRALTISEEQASGVRSWVESQEEIRRFRVGPIMRDSEVVERQRRDPDFPGLGD